MADVNRGNYRPGKLGCGESRLCGKRAVGKTARVGSVTWGKWHGEDRPGESVRGEVSLDPLNR